MSPSGTPPVFHLFAIDRTILYVTRGSGRGAVGRGIHGSRAHHGRGQQVPLLTGFLLARHHTFSSSVSYVFNLNLAICERQEKTILPRQEALAASAAVVGAKVVKIEITSLTSNSFNGHGVAPPPYFNWSLLQPSFR